MNEQKLLLSVTGSRHGLNERRLRTSFALNTSRVSSDVTFFLVLSLKKLLMCFRCQSWRSRHATSQKNQSDGRTTTHHA